MDGHSFRDLFLRPCLPLSLSFSASHSRCCSPSLVTLPYTVISLKLGLKIHYSQVCTATRATDTRRASTGVRVFRAQGCCVRDFRGGRRRCGEAGEGEGRRTATFAPSRSGLVIACARTRFTILPSPLRPPSLSLVRAKNRILLRVLRKFFAFASVYLDRTSRICVDMTYRARRDKSHKIASCFFPVAAMKIQFLCWDATQADRMAPPVVARPPTSLWKWEEEKMAARARNFQTLILRRRSCVVRRNDGRTLPETRAAIVFGYQ